MTQSVLLFNYRKPHLSELNAHWSIHMHYCKIRDFFMEPLHNEVLQ